MSYQFDLGTSNGVKFDEKDYFEFYPLHVLHKTKKAIRRKKVATQEGTYAVNKNESKIERIRPL